MSNFTCSCLLCTDITYNLGHFTGYVQYTARIIHIALCVYSLIMTKTLFFNQNYGFKSSSFVYLVCTCIYNMDRSISCLCFPSCLVLIFNIRPQPYCLIANVEFTLVIQILSRITFFYSCVYFVCLLLSINQSYCNLCHSSSIIPSRYQNPATVPFKRNQSISGSV